MTQEELSKNILDSVYDPIPGSNTEFGWDGKDLYYRCFISGGDWQKVTKLKFNASRVVSISKMLERNGIDD